MSQQQQKWCLDGLLLPVALVIIQISSHCTLERQTATTWSTAATSVAHAAPLGAQFAATRVRREEMYK